MEPQTPVTTSGGPPALKDDEKTFALLAHLSPLMCLAFIGPIVALVAKQDSEFVKYHATQALIFQGNVSSWWARIIVGALLLIFIVLQKLLTRRTDAAD